MSMGRKLAGEEGFSRHPLNLARLLFSLTRAPLCRSAFCSKRSSVSPIQTPYICTKQLNSVGKKEAAVLYTGAKMASVYWLLGLFLHSLLRPTAQNPPTLYTSNYSQDAPLNRVLAVYSLSTLHALQNCPIISEPQTGEARDYKNPRLQLPFKYL